ncbi:phage tail tape measure protein [Bradyrhizobium sp. DASA03007]
MHYKNAQAFMYLHNKVGDDKLNLSRRIYEQEQNLLAAHLRNEQIRQRRHFTNIARMRREAMGAFGSMSRIGNRAAPYAVAAAGATGYGAVSAFRTRMRADTAETNLRMFGEMSQDEVRKMRQSYGNGAAIKYGLSPDKMIDAYTEVIKAGVPKDKAQAVTDTILKSGAGLDLDLKETTKFATRVATLTQDMSKLDPDKLKSVLNAVAIANIDTAADSNEIIAANRRAAGVLVNKNFKAEDLSAFTSIGVSAGLQSAKAGSAIQFMYNELAGAKNARGKRAQDLAQVGNMLHMGGREGLSRKMLASPADTMMEIFKRISGMNPQDQAKALNLLGMREWRDELAVFAKEYPNLVKVLADIRDPKNKLKLDEISAQKLKSLSGRWKSLTSAMALIWEAAGAGLEKAFGEISEFFTGYLQKFDTQKISSIVEGFTTGLVQGLGYENWTAMLKDSFGDPKDFDAAGWAEKVRLFTKGFMSELVKMWHVASEMFNGAAAAFGGSDPEALGRFTGHILELIVALKSIGTLAETMNNVITFFKGFAAILGVLKLTPVMRFIAGYAGAAPAIAGATTNQEDDELNNGADKWKMLRDKYGQATIDAARKKYQPWYQFGKGYAGENEQWIKQYLEEKAKDPNFKKSSYTGSTDFSGRRRTSDLADSLTKFTGKVERAAFINSGPGGLQYAALGGGSGRGLSGSGGGSLGGRIIGGVPALLKSTPGSALPNMGIGPSGSIIRRDKIPSFGGVGPGGIPGSLNKGAFERTFAGTPLAGKYDSVVAAARRAGVSPALLASVMAQETGRGKHMLGNNPGGIMGKGGLMQFGDLDAGIDRTALAVAKNYNAAGGDLAKMRDRYAPLGASNDPRGLNGSWLPGVQKFMGEMGDGTQVASNSAAAIAPGVTPGLADKLGLRGKANFMHGQYGGVGENLQTITLASGKKLTVNAAAAESFKGFADELEASGYKISSIGGFDKRGKRKGGGWSQHAYGNAIDINPGKNAQDGTGRTDMPANVRDMAAKYGLSWGGDWSKKYNDPMHFEWNGSQPWKQKGVTDQVPPASMIQNVPPPASPASGMLQTMNGGGGGPVQIHINGSSHDPEALATLVQRRIDESMNWRTHDTSSEYT